MTMHLYQIPFYHFFGLVPDSAIGAIGTETSTHSIPPAAPDISLTPLPPRLLGTSLFLDLKTDPKDKADHLLKVSLQGMVLYRHFCFQLIGVLEKKDKQAFCTAVQEAIASSRNLLDRMPDYSQESGPLRHLYSSLLQPFVSIQRNFGMLLAMSEQGWSFASLQSLVAQFLLNEADHFMEYLDRDNNGYFVDMTRRQLASQVIDYFYRRTSKIFFKDGLLLMRSTPQTKAEEGFVSIGGVMHYSVVNIAADWKWPVDPEKNEALKIYLDILGWKMWKRDTDDGVTYAIDFGPYAILEGYPVNQKVAEEGSVLSSQMLGKMTALALFEDLKMLNQVRAIAAGDSSMRSPALLVINRIPQLKPMVGFTTYREFVEKADEILQNEKLNLNLMRRRESDKKERSARIQNFMLGPVTVIRLLREEMLRRKPEWRLEPQIEEQWLLWEKRVRELTANL